MQSRVGLAAVLGLGLALALAWPLQAEQVTTFGTGGGGSGGGTGACTTNTAVLFNSANAIACDSGLTYLGTGQLTITNSTANTTPLTLTGGSITGSSTVRPGISLTGTLNTSGVVDGAVLFANITNTASGAGSKMLDLQVASASQFSVDTAGVIRGATSSNTLNLAAGASDITLSNGGTNRFINLNGDKIVIGSGGAGQGVLQFNTDVTQSRFAAGRLGLSNTTNATEFDAFSTTDSTSSPTNSAYAYLKAGATAGEFDLGSTHTGSSTGLTKFNLLVDGTSKLDYAVTTASAWTFGAAATFSGIVTLPAGATTAGQFDLASAINGMTLGAGRGYQWTSGTFAPGNVDTSLWRLSAGVIEVGTSSSAGSGGALKAANYQAGIVYSAAGTALPSCVAGLNGTLAFVSDSTVSAYGTTYTSGGANNEPVFCNGTNWIIGEIANDNMKDVA